MRASYGWASLGLPLFVFYIFAFIIPQIIFLSTSLYAPVGPDALGGLSLSHYRSVLSDDYYLEAFQMSALVSAAVALIGVVLAFPIAFYVAHSRSRWGLVVLIVLAGMLFSNAVVRTLGWRILLSTVGPVNVALLDIGIISEPLVLLDSYRGVIIGTIHALLPIHVVALIPVCHMVQRTLLHASAGLGASRWQTFWRVIFPLTRNGIIASTLLVFANSIGAFTTPALLGGGRVLLVPILIRERILLALDWPAGATLATLLFIMVLLTIVAITAFGLRTRSQTANRL